MRKTITSARRYGAFIDYVKNKEIKARTPYTIEPDGTGYYVLNGKQISDKAMNQLYPTGLINTCVHFHIDSRQLIF